MRLFLLVFPILFLLSASEPVLVPVPSPLPPEKALKIANLESRRNALAADLSSTVLQAERLQKQLQDAQSAYLAAVEAERSLAKLDAACKLVDNTSWECPVKPKPSAAPKSTTPENLEKEKK